jgi:hypothetical protein
VTVVYENGSRDPHSYCPVGQKEISTLKDLLMSDFIPNCSTMFRRGLFDRFPDWYSNRPMGDWPLSLRNAKHGEIGYIDEVMGVYRVHSGAVWSSRELVDKIRGTIVAYRAMNTHLGSGYHRLTRLQIAFQYYWLADEYMRHGNRLRALGNLFKCVVASPFEPPVPAGLLLRMTAKLCFPRFYGLLVLCKRTQDRNQKVEPPQV